MGTIKSRTVIVSVLIGAVLLAGVIVAIVGSQTPDTFGWFAYAPLSDTTFIPGDAIVVQRVAAIGFVMIILSVVALTFMIGTHVARRRTGKQSE